MTPLWHSLDLSPGEYDITAVTTAPKAGDQATHQDVTVIAGQAASVQLYVIYP